MKTQYYTASSLDGFIADPHDSLGLRAVDRIVAEENRTVGQAPYRTNALPIRIGHNVWIGGGTIVLGGVTIGDNVTIGAGSVVTSDIPSDWLAFGQPCRVQPSL